MVYNPELYAQTKLENSEREFGNFESALAGLATGLWNIPKGFVSLGAELYDLVGDANTAKEVEEWFEKVNPFEEAAEAKTIGKITTAIASVAPVGVGGAILGARVGKLATERLAKAALEAKKNNKFFSLANFGSKVASPLPSAVIGGGIGESVVSDEDIGTFADMLRGTSLEPYAITMMDIEEKEGREEAYRRLLNRLKFGTEGALFNLAVIGAGKGISQLRNPSETGRPEYSENPLARFFQKYFTLGTLGNIDRESFVAQRAAERSTEIAKSSAYDLTNTLEKSLKGSVPDIQQKFFPNLVLGSKELEEGVNKKIANILSSSDSKLLDFNTLSKRIRDEGKIITEGKKITEDIIVDENTGFIKYKDEKLNSEEIKKIADDFSIDISDYKDATKRSKEFNDLVQIIKKSQGEDKAKLFEDTILNMRLAVDNLSINALKKGLQKKEFKTVFNNLGSYLTTDYEIFIKKNPFERYKPISENLAELEKLPNVIKGKQRYVEDKFGKKLEDVKPEELTSINKQWQTDLDNFLKKRSDDEVDLLNKTRERELQLGKEINSVRPDPSVLIPKVLEPWQQEVYGIVKDPKYTFVSTIGKLANLNYTVKFLNDVEKIGTKAEAVILKEIKNKRLVEVTQTINGKKVPVYKSFQEKISDQQLKESKNILLKDRILKRFSPNYVLKEDELRALNKEVEDELSNFIIKEEKEYITDWQKILEPKKLTKEEFFNKNSIFTADELDVLGKDKDNVLQFKKIEPIKGFEYLSGMEGKYMKAPIHDAVFDVTNDFLTRSNVGTLYRYAILAPKGISQIAKTILSPITHVRNFITAGAFAAANGAIFPSLGDIRMLAPEALGGKGLVGQAYSLTGKKLLGTMTEADKLLYNRLARVDVIGTQFEARQIKDLFNSSFTSNESNIFNTLSDRFKTTKKIYGKIQDAYVAEDDFWKVINWNLERNRYENILTNAGVTKNNYLEKFNENSKLGEFLRDPKLNKELVNESYETFLDEFAGNLVRNQVPNYDYVGQAARTLRLSPFGNFIAFPLEMMRTGSNIYDQAIREITSGIPEIRNLGLRRLTSFGMTVGGIPLAVVQTGKALNNVTDEELTALRRYVPDWSKNSTLVPTGRDEKGYMKYIDFSYANPYDVLIRPLNTIFSQIAEGKDNKESLSKALGEGLIEGATELLKPFASESIYTEALVDSTLRRGIGRNGKRIWSEEDDPFVKILKSISHVAEAFTPGSISQFKRIDQAIKGVSDEYGKSFDVFDELPGLIGFRSIQSDPENGLKYKVTQFGSRLDKDRNLFSSQLLKGGRVEPKDIINNYEYSEARRFQTMKDMYADIRAARTLGVSDSIIQNKLKARKGMDKDVISSVMKGQYLPDTPNKFFIEKIQEITNNLNRQEGTYIPSPYSVASPTINSIINKNKKLNLLTDTIEFPAPSLGSGTLEPQSILPAGVNTTPTPIINDQISSLSNQRTSPITGLTETQTALLSPEEQIIQQRLNKNKPVTLVG